MGEEGEGKGTVGRRGVGRRGGQWERGTMGGDGNNGRGEQ